MIPSYVAPVIYMSKNYRKGNFYSFSIHFFAVYKYVPRFCAEVIELSAR